MIIAPIIKVRRKGTNTPKFFLVNAPKRPINKKQPAVAKKVIEIVRPKEVPVAMLSMKRYIIVSDKSIPIPTQ